MEYWIYENWQRDKRRVLAHAEDCPDCKPAPSKRAWHGPFESVRKAELVTLALGRNMHSVPGYSDASVRWCERCVSRIPETRLNRGHTLDLVVVDVAALRVADELDRRDSD